MARLLATLSICGAACGGAPLGPGQSDAVISPSAALSGPAAPEPPAPEAPLQAATAWVALPNLLEARWRHTLTVLSDGTLVVIGGTGADNEPLASIELLRPGASLWARAGSLRIARASHSATALDGSRIIVVGGEAGQGDAPNHPQPARPLFETEIVDVDRHASVPGPSLAVPRGRHDALLNELGELWILGGCSGDTTPCPIELLDSMRSRFVVVAKQERGRDAATAWATRASLLTIASRLAGPPLVQAVDRARVETIAHELPPLTGLAAARIAHRVVLVVGETGPGQWHSWTYDEASRRFTEAATPPAGVHFGLLRPAPGHSAVVFDDDRGYRFGGAAWQPLPAPPSELYASAIAATADSLVLTGGFERRPDQPGDEISVRAARLAFTARR